ncbi:hypothetical protein PRVXT_002540 [Proteinivorax tanatarense]|uniref:Uncharacterized protein n=1 Tax=Proteinivorax tanatarense TaxID=1260629 RepID=A0AAU7VKE9_9FIRM
MDDAVKFFIKSLGGYRELLPRQTLKTLKGQALSGNLEGAKKGLQRKLEEARK